MAEIVAADREQLADWIETSLLVRGTRQLGLDALYGLASEEAHVEPAAVNLAIRTMANRQRLLGERYPFRVHDVAVQGQAHALRSPYVALLLLTPEGTSRQLLHSAPTPEMAVLFERLAGAAIEDLLGAGAQAIRFAWPSEIGRPPEFPDAIAWLAEKMNIKPGSAYRPPRRKDGGVDVVAWRPFPDGRSGFPVMLVQCTLQREILSKAADVDVRYWSGWLTLDSEPLTALAVPQTISPGVVWDEIAVRCLILERIRLAGLLAPTAEIGGSSDFIAGDVEVLASALGAAEL